MTVIARSALIFVFSISLVVTCTAIRVGRVPVRAPKKTRSPSQSTARQVGRSSIGVGSAAINAISGALLFGMTSTVHGGLHHHRLRGKSIDCCW